MRLGPTITGSVSGSVSLVSFRGDPRAPFEPTCTLKMSFLPSCSLEYTSVSSPSPTVDFGRMSATFAWLSPGFEPGASASTAPATAATATPLLATTSAIRRRGRGTGLSPRTVAGVDVPRVPRVAVPPDALPGAGSCQSRNTWVTVASGSTCSVDSGSPSRRSISCCALGRAEGALIIALATISRRGLSSPSRRGSSFTARKSRICALPSPKG